LNARIDTLASPTKKYNSTSQPIVQRAKNHEEKSSKKF
jgi:hypothetical protein